MVPVNLSYADVTDRTPDREQMIQQRNNNTQI